MLFTNCMTFPSSRPIGAPSKAVVDGNGGEHTCEHSAYGPADSVNAEGVERIIVAHLGLQNGNGPVANQAGQESRSEGQPWATQIRPRA